MSSRLAPTNPSERPNAPAQTAPAAAPRGAGIGEAPTTMASACGDSCISIFNQIWTCLSSILTALWTWLTELCVCRETASTPLGRLNQITARNILRTSGRDGLDGLLNSTRIDLEAHILRTRNGNTAERDCKAALVIRLDGRILEVIPNRMTLFPANGGDQTLKQLGESVLNRAFTNHPVPEANIPITEATELSMALLVLDRGAGGELYVASHRNSIANLRGANSGGAWSTTRALFEDQINELARDDDYRRQSLRAHFLENPAIL